MTSGRRSWFTASGNVSKIRPDFAITANTEDRRRRNVMALTMSDKQAARKDGDAWPAALQEEFAAEARRPNGCVGSELVSETDKVRVWTIRLRPGQRFGFHRHVLNYFWTAVTPCRG